MCNMEPNGVPVCNSPSSNSSVLCSPGNNPFDDLLKKTVDAVARSEYTNRRSSICFSDFPDTGRRTLSFHDLNSSESGRESLGILPPDFGRDSLGFLNINSSEIGRESLGIFHISGLKESLSFRRESLGLLNLTDIGRQSLDCGKESLGILHIKSPDIKFPDEDKQIPEILLSTIEENSSYMCSPLDTAFLQPCSKKSSVASSATYSVTPSFNSNSLEGPSRIHSLSSFQDFENSKSEILNKRFYNANESNNLTSSISSFTSSIHSFLNKGKIFSSSDLPNLRSRIQSLPVALEEHCGALNGVNITDNRKFWTTNRAVRTKPLERRSFHGTLDFSGDTSDEFYDSVFIEGHHIAEKIADGSILNDSSGSEMGILDCTPQPTWPEDLSFSEKEKEDVKCDTETIFKTVDKMLPPPLQDTVRFKLKVSKSDDHFCNQSDVDKTDKSNSRKLSQTSEKNDSKLIQNMSDIPHESSKNSGGQRSYSRSRDAKEILQNLSEILNSTNRSDQQKSEGQNLLCSLADILYENKSILRVTSPDDSGHSSINEHFESPRKENHECFEVLDLRTKNSREEISKTDESHKGVLDLSVKSKPVENVDKHITQSPSSKNIKNLSVNAAKKKNAPLLGLDINKNRNISANSSVNSNNSNNSRNSNNASKLLIAGKLRVKSANCGVKKGPLKAVIPVGDMKKRYSLPVTPERTEPQLSSVMQSKRTSTPINEPKLKPVAASTPTPRPIKGQKGTTESSSSTVKRAEASSSSSKDRNKPAVPSLPKSLNMSSKFIRRNSVSEVKNMEPVGRKRSHSVENETGVMSSLAKVRQNIVNSPYYQLKKQIPLKESNSFTDVTENSTKLTRNKGLPVGKPVNSISKVKKPGKENIQK